jgi:signal transduction histidine kinase
MHKFEQSKSGKYVPHSHKGVSATNIKKHLPFILNLRFRVLVCFFLVASFSVGILTFWIHKSALTNEYASVNEKHLIVAQNLSSGLSRYVEDVRKTYEFILDNSENWSRGIGIPGMLSKFNMRYIAIIDSDNNVEMSVLGSREKHFKLPTENKLKDLRLMALESEKETIFSGIQSFDGTPHFFIVRALSGDKFAFAPLRPDYVNTVQKAITFGKQGHSMIVDQFGRVIAHPNPEWQASSKDASKLPVVQLMISGKTGVTEFYSPPMKADMIAGYTYIPETGWGVMVPQPQEELIDRAASLIIKGNLVSILSIFLALAFGWWISGHLTRPISKIITAAQQLTKGKKDIRVDPLPAYTPQDLHILASTFNSMVDELNQKTTILSKELIKSEAGNKAKSDFLGMMSHEIRTPLTGVIGALALLSDSSLDNEQNQLIDVAANSASELLQILDNVLMLVQIDENSIALQIKLLDIKQIATEAYDQLKHAARSKGLKLEYSVNETAPVKVFGDPKIIMQVILILASNAIKFTSKGDIKVELNIAIHSENMPELTIIVKDTGIGIQNEKQPKIFSSFYQSDQSHSRSYGGIGIGLTIAKHLVTLMDGQIYCESILGQGSTFTVTLPAQNRPQYGD